MTTSLVGRMEKEVKSWMKLLDEKYQKDERTDVWEGSRKNKVDVESSGRSNKQRNEPKVEIKKWEPG